MFDSRNELRGVGDVHGVTHTGTPYDRNGRTAAPARRQPVDASRARAVPWWVTVRDVGAVFVRQVLLRPLRIGTLVVLAAAVVAVVTGAQGWWVILGVVLFQTAGSALIVLWTDGERDQPPERSPRRSPEPPAPRSPEPDTQDEEPSEPPEPEVPGQRTPGEE